MEKTCRSCQKTQSIGHYSSFYIRSDAKEKFVEYYRPECRECHAAHTYQKKGKTFGAKLTEREETDLRTLWPSQRTGGSFAAIHRDAGLKMTYRTFLKYCQAGTVEKWYRHEE